MDNPLTITEIEIIPIKAKQGLVGFANCVVNDQFFIGNIAIHSTFNENEFRLVYPAKAIKNKKPVQCVYPINKETAQAMQKAICKAFRKLFVKYTDYKQIEFL